MAGPTFTDRHIGVRQTTDVELMLKDVGLDSVDDLVDRAVPSSIRQEHALTLAEAQTEAEVLTELRRLAAKNRPAIQLIGQGYHDTITPPVIRRNILEAPAWYTAYTPYQPEISQGRLEALLNFQTMVQDLVALPVANASLLDEATADAPGEQEGCLRQDRTGRRLSATDHRGCPWPGRGARLRGGGCGPVRGTARRADQRGRSAAARRVWASVRPPGPDRRGP
jgi:hypothetical protein